MPCPFAHVWLYGHTHIYREGNVPLIGPVRINVWVSILLGSLYWIIILYVLNPSRYEWMIVFWYACFREYTWLSLSISKGGLRVSYATKCISLYILREVNPLLLTPIKLDTHVFRLVKNLPIIILDAFHKGAGLGFFCVGECVGF